MQCRECENLIRANAKLVDKNRDLISDIKMLISFIKGNENVEYMVKNIIKNYEKKEG